MTWIKMYCFFFWDLIATALGTALFEGIKKDSPKRPFHSTYYDVSTGTITSVPNGSTVEV